MEMQLTQLKLEHKMDLSLRIEFSNMLGYRNLGGLLENMVKNPEIVEDVVDKIDYNTNSDSGKKSNVLATLAFLFDTEKKASKKNKGLIMNGSLDSLKTFFDPEGNDLSADVVYVSQGRGKPELYFSDRLIIKPELLVAQIPKKYKNANNIYTKVLKRHQWQTGMLREAYGLIGEKQREFISSLDKLHFNKYDTGDLSGDLGFKSESTTHRLLSGRAVGISSPICEDVLYCGATDLLKTNGKIKEIHVKDRLIKYFLSEKEKGRDVLNDELLCEKLELPIERRTLSKYRTELGVPGSQDRKRIYSGV